MSSPAKGHSEPASLWTPSEGDVMLSAATRAPSLHNSQPWEFGVGNRHVEVYLVPSRRLPHSDASGRFQLVSCGAALFNLRVAAAHLGMHPSVELLPGEADPTLIAILYADHRHERPSSLDTCYPAIGARRTNRMPLSARRTARARRRAPGEEAGASVRRGWRRGRVPRTLGSTGAAPPLPDDLTTCPCQLLVSGSYVQDTASGVRGSEPNDASGRDQCPGLPKADQRPDRHCPAALGRAAGDTYGRTVGQTCPRRQS